MKMNVILPFRRRVLMAGDDFMAYKKAGGMSLRPQIAHGIALPGQLVGDVIFSICKIRVFYSSLSESRNNPAAQRDTFLKG